MECDQTLLGYCEISLFAAHTLQIAGAYHSIEHMTAVALRMTLL